MASVGPCDAPASVNPPRPHRSLGRRLQTAPAHPNPSPLSVKQLPSSLIASLSLSALVLGGCGRSDQTAKEAPDAGAPVDLANGRAVFNRICFVCHQTTGLGVPGVFPPLAGSPIATEADPRRIVRIVLNGLQGPIDVGGKPFNNVMPPQGAALSDKDISDVLSYVRSSWGNAAQAVSPATVSAIRSSSNRQAPWTWDELSKL